MDIQLFIFYTVCFTSGGILLVFNKRVGAYLEANSLKAEVMFSVLNSRETVLAVGSVFTVLGFLGAVDQLGR